MAHAESQANVTGQAPNELPGSQLPVFAAQAADGCCTPAEQATCCTADAKPTCCGPVSTEGCGCR